MAFNIRIPFVTASHVLKRSGTTAISNKSKAAGIGVDTADSYQLKYNRNATVGTVVDKTLAQTLTNKTLTAPTISSPVLSGSATGTYTLAGTPTITSPTITGATITGTIGSDTKVLATPSITYTSNSTPATITGFSWTVVAGATYIFDAELFTTITTVGGLTVAFGLTTATLTSIQYATYASTASDNTTAVSTQGTTATSGTKMFDSKTAAYTKVRVYGSFVVNAGGTFALQGSQNTSASGGDVSIILFGSIARMTRVL